MIIISKFHDYYDHGMAFGYDSSDIRYIRDTICLNASQMETVYPDMVNTPVCKSIKQRNKCFELIPFTVGFCGVIYRGVRVRWFNYDKFETLHFYNFVNLSEYLLINFKYKLEPPEKKKIYYYRQSIKYREFLDGNKFADKRFYDEMVRQRHVIVLYILQEPKTERWWVDPRLKDIEFYRAVDPFTTYQEISMWIGGILPQPDRPMVTVSDAVKIHKRGFDKWSFRKPPVRKGKK